MNASSQNPQTATAEATPLETTPTSQSAAVSTASTKQAPKKAPRVLMGLLGTALVIGTGVWFYNRGKESTDDAQIEGHVVTVSVRIPGQVKKVLVEENQLVNAGDVIVEMDLEELKARLNVARAERSAAEASLALAQAQLTLTERTANAGIRQARGAVSQAAYGVTSSKAQLEQVQADIDAALSRRQLAAKELSRIKDLFAQGSVSQAELDARQAVAEQSNAALELAKARYESSRASISGNYGGVEQAQGRLVAALSAPQQVQAAEAQVQLSQARLDQSRAAERLAELNLSYGVVRAPVAGVVSRKNVEPGNLVAPERPILALVPLDDVWVVANFKEDQIGGMRSGQAVTIQVDGYSGIELSGHVESIAAGTGARFALLPPDNATGNFVKVVQRVPVRIRFDANKGLILRPGMSAAVTVRVP